MKTQFLLLRNKLGDATLAVSGHLGLSLFTLVLLWLIAGCLSSCTPRNILIDGRSYTKVHSARGWDYIQQRDLAAWKSGSSVQHYELQRYTPINVAGR